MHFGSIFFSDYGTKNILFRNRFFFTISSNYPIKEKGRNWSEAFIHFTKGMHQIWVLSSRFWNHGPQLGIAQRSWNEWTTVSLIIKYLFNWSRSFIKRFTSIWLFQILSIEKLHLIIVSFDFYFWGEKSEFLQSRTPCLRGSVSSPRVTTTPQAIQVIRAIPTEPVPSKTPLGEMKIPDPAKINKPTAT